jgi:hypothetical protein
MTTPGFSNHLLELGCPNSYQPTLPWAFLLDLWTTELKEQVAGGVEHPGWLQDHEIQESIYTDQTQSFTLLGKDVTCIPSAVSTNQRCTSWHRKLATSSIWGYGLSAHSIEVIGWDLLLKTWSAHSTSWNYLQSKVCLSLQAELWSLHEMYCNIPNTHSVPPSSVACFRHHSMQAKCMTRSKKESTSEKLLRIRDITCSRRLTMNPICTIIVAQPRTQ